MAANARVAEAMLVEQRAWTDNSVHRHRNGLVCTRGPNFPLSRLETRLLCPACGSRSVTVVLEPPSNRQAANG